MAEPIPIKETVCTITPIAPTAVADVWFHVKPLLEPAVERSNGRWTMEHLLSALVLGNQQLWIAHHNDKVFGALTTQIVSYPNNKMIACQFLGGSNFGSWSHDMLDVIKEYTRQAGCQGIETVARIGFWPFFKKEDFDRAYTVYEHFVRIQP